MTYFSFQKAEPVDMQTFTPEQLEAINPDTPLVRLQAIAQDAPELRPLLALNPSTYPDLLSWLAELQDAQVDQALAKRDELFQHGELDSYATMCLSAPSSSSEPPVLSEPQVSQQISEPSEQLIDPQPQTSQPMEPPVAEPSQPDMPASPTAEQPETSANELELYQDELTPATVAAAEMAAMNRARTETAQSAQRNCFLSGSTLPTGEKLSDQPSSPAQTAKSRCNRFWLWLCLGFCIWLVVIAAVVWGMNHQADKPVSMKANAADPTPNVSATPQELVQNGLPDGYTGPTKTIEVPGPTPGQTIKRVVPDESASSTPTPTPTNPLAAPANAKKLNSFTTADGNIRCIFGASQVQCFANYTDPYYCSAQAPNSGYSDVLYASHSRSHEFSCIEPIDIATEGTLGANEAVTNGNFACRASQSGNRVVCWNTTAGDGIVVGNDLAARFGKGTYVPAQWDK